MNKVDPEKGAFAAQLKPRPATNVPPNQIVRGRVTGSGRKPVFGAVVSVEQTAVGDSYIVGSSPQGTDPVAVTDRNGQFELRCPVPFESMNLRIEAAGFARRYIADLRPGHDQKDLVLEVGARLNGRVTLNGKPAQGVTVAAVQASSFEQWVGAFTTGTGADGRFTVYNLPADREYAVYATLGSVQKFGAVPVRTIKVKGDGSVNDIGKLAITPGLRLAGQVWLTDSNAVPTGAALIVERQAAWGDYTEVLLPPDGRFSLSNLPPETLSLSLTRVAGYRYSARNASLNPSNPSALIGRLEKDTTNLSILLEPGEYRYDEFHYDEARSAPNDFPLGGIEDTRNTQTISGRVLDATSKAPLQGFQIKVGRRPRLSGFPVWERSSRGFSNGNFGISLARLGGSVLFKLEAEGYRPILAEPLSQTGSNLVFLLELGGGPAGVVRHLDGTPAADVEVCYLGAWERAGVKLGKFGPSPDKPLVTDGTGRFAFPPKAGPGEIVAVCSRGVAQLPITCFETNLLLTLQPWGRVRGRLISPEKTAANQQIDIYSETEIKRGLPWIMFSTAGASDAEGSFVMDHVPPGSCRLSTRPTSGVIQTARFTIRPGEELDLLDIPTAGSPSTAKP